MFAIGLAALAYSADAYTAAALADQVFNLPGAENLTISFNQFSGYLSVSQTKMNHYWMVESKGDPANDPVVFWTNGGPGCSGLIGMFTEQGPFRPNADMSLSMNQYAWNNLANMVFIEQPCGVGYSYSTKPADYFTGDSQAAVDNYDMIQAFMVRFPEKSANPLYISSESYGGHYMPTLSKVIVDNNAGGLYPQLNFKGMMVGNPYTDVYSGTGAGMDTYWGHQVISKPMYDKYVLDCADPSTMACLLAELEIDIEVDAVLNPYALDYPLCTTSSGRIRPRGKSAQVYQLKDYIRRSAGFTEEQIEKARGFGMYEPCEDDYTTQYLNLPAVKTAIHVDPSITWGECSYAVHYNATDGQQPMMPYYNYLIDGGFGLNILVYSGDDDGVCATVGTQSWIWNLGYTVTSGWKPWLYPDPTYGTQLAGFVTKWPGLSFVTVRNAGHEVPTYTPQVALQLFQSYLTGIF
jgi:carboxypeptidase C (cathepsin A)